MSPQTAAQTEHTSVVIRANLAKAEGAMTVIQRAQVALGTPEYEKQLISLVGRSTSIVAITGPDSYTECRNARIALKRVRVEIEKVGKAAREDAQLFSRGIIAEEKRLVSISSPEEERLHAIETTYDDKINAEKAERERVEAERVAKIKARIQEIGDDAVKALGKPPIVIQAMLAETEDIDINDSFAEFKEEAIQAKMATIVRLTQLHADAVKAETDRAELAKLRAEKEQREREQNAAAQELPATTGQDDSRNREASEQTNAQSEVGPTVQQPAPAASIVEAGHTILEATLRIEANTAVADRIVARNALLAFKDQYGRLSEFAAITRAILYYFKEHP